MAAWTSLFQNRDDQQITNKSNQYKFIKNFPLKHEEDFQTSLRRFSQKIKTISGKDLDKFQATKATSQQTVRRL